MWRSALRRSSSLRSSDAGGALPWPITAPAVIGARPHRRRPAAGRDEALARAMRAAAAAGVTRLADVTGLDVLGVPVFQAIRPFGRTVSVHQGKALTTAPAMIGALMEAVETDHAEAFPAAFEGEQWTRPFETLPRDERAPCLADFAARRVRAPDADESLAWVAADRLAGRGRLWAPLDTVRLDFCTPGDRRLDRTSNGLGARFDREGAALKALLELVERDAERAWFALPPHVRTRHLLEASSAPLAWFQRLRERVRRAGLSLAVYWLPAIVPAPVFLCELHESAAGGDLRARAMGVGCALRPGEALLAAVTEAAQSRLTAISGARDDILHVRGPRLERGAFGVALPAPACVTPILWEEVEEAFATPLAATAEALAVALARAGYPDAAIVDLSPPSPAGGGALVVKALAPGLGAFARARRPAGLGEAA